MEKYRLIKQIVLLVTLIGIMSASVYADRKYDREGRRDDRRSENASKNFKHDNRRHVYTNRRNARADDRRHPSGYRLDKRYRHNRYYPPRGYHINVLPQKHYEIRYHRRPYYFSGGIWYGRSGGLYVVMAPPLGIFVPMLPPFYTTIWASGVPYYYANDVYYTWQPARNGYVVTNPPATINEQATKPLAEQLFIYPKKGQSKQKQADDKYECHRWGVKQTGYDPSEPAGNISQDTLNHKREDYQHAMKACLEGRGYSVQ